MLTLAPDDPRALAAVEAIHAGDIPRLEHLLAEHPELATATIGAEHDADSCDVNRTLLHILTDFPGHLPNGAAAVTALVAAGAHVDARCCAVHTETPLHWAASCDDVEVLDALLDAGADIEAAGAVIAAGTPISDATAFGQWRAAGRLLERGATTRFWEAATMGLLDRLDAAFASDTPPSADDITVAFWGACHGGQRRAAEHLLARGADINWIGWDDLTPLDAARRSAFDHVVAWLEAQGARSASQG